MRAEKDKKRNSGNSGKQNLTSAIQTSVQEYIKKLEREVTIEMNAKNEAYSFILSQGLFFDFKKFHEEHGKLTRPTAKDWISNMFVKHKSN